MATDFMTPAERWEAVLRRRTPDRVPMDYWSTPEFDAKLMRHLSVATRWDLIRRLRADVPVKLEPRYVGPALSHDRDEFGVLFRDVDYGTGVYRECVRSPLSDFRNVEEIEQGYVWPSPDWWDYSGVRDQLRGLEEYPVRAGGSEPFLTYKQLRGQEQAFLDLVENPEIARYCLEKLFHLAYENTRRLIEQASWRVLLVYVAEDLGGQTDLMMSPRHIEEFLVPGMKRMIDLAHGAGAFVFHHDDGSCRRILPRMIELGIDILNPIQWRCPGMEREGLKKDFGDRLVFHGAVDNQFTLPFGNVEDVRREVRDNLRLLGEGGGFILGPCHNIQPLTPVENVLAMYETGHEAGRTR